MTDKYYDELDQEVQQASSGGGMVGQVAVYGAFQVYASLPPAERIFLYGGRLKKEDALAKAEKLAAGGKVEQTLCTLQYKDSILGRDVSHWKGDRYHTYGPHWAIDAQTFNTMRIALGVKAAVKTWVRMGSIVSPNAEELVGTKNEKHAWEDGKDGEKQLKRMHLPVAVFTSKADAEAAAASTATATTVDDPSFPGLPGWKKYDDWVTYGKAEVRKMAAAMTKNGIIPLSAEDCAKIAEDCECSPDQVKFVLSEPSDG